MRRTLAAAMLGGAACFGGVSSHAQTADPPRAAATLDSPTNRQAEARSLYQAGSKAFEHGDYDDALEKFRAAYELAPVAALLFNIAQTHRLRTPPHCREALRHYELYLAAEPRAPERDEITLRMPELRACAEAETQREARSSVVVAPAPSAEPPEVRRSRAPLWLAGAGTAVALVGAGLYTRAYLEYEEVRGTCPCPPGTFDGWERVTQAGLWSMGAGAVVAVTGLFWWRFGPSSGERSATVTLGPSSLAIGGRF